MQADLARKNQSLLVSLVCLVLGMGMLAFAAVPLYDLFCRVTGYGGTTAEGSGGDRQVLEREVTVTFNTDTQQDMPWSFTPLQRRVTVPIGRRTLVAFEATNHSNQPVSGTATYNVTPFKVGQYFVKTQCFCFERQTLPPGETMRFPVSFYLDPRMDSDDDAEEVNHMTLSYTFFQTD